MSNSTSRYQDQVVAAVAARLGWSAQDARNAVGDTTEYEAEGLPVEDAADAVIDGIESSL